MATPDERRDEARQDQREHAGCIGCATGVAHDHPPAEVVRYILITLPLPDGSNGTPDPEDVVERVIDDLDGHIPFDADISQVYPDDLVRGGDVD